MQIQAYLVISNTGSLRVVKNRPYLNNREIAVLLNIDVPKAFFERLMPVVNIELPPEAIANPSIESVVKITALEIADKLNLKVDAVEDGLKDLIEQARHPMIVVEGGEQNA